MPSSAKHQQITNGTTKVKSEIDKVNENNAVVKMRKRSFFFNVESGVIEKGGINTLQKKEKKGRFLLKYHVTKVILFRTKVASFIMSSSFQKNNYKYVFKKLCNGERKNKFQPSAISS